MDVGGETGSFYRRRSTSVRITLKNDSCYCYRESRDEAVFFLQDGGGGDEINYFTSIRVREKLITGINIFIKACNRIEQQRIPEELHKFVY